MSEKEQAANGAQDKDSDIVDGVIGDDVGDAFWKGCFAFIFEVEGAKVGTKATWCNESVEVAYEHVFE